MTSNPPAIDGPRGRALDAAALDDMRAAGREVKADRPSAIAWPLGASRGPASPPAAPAYRDAAGARKYAPWAPAPSPSPDTSPGRRARHGAPPPDRAR